MVPEIDQRLAQVADVDALTADMGLAAIGEQRDTQSAISVDGHKSPGFRGC